MSFEDLNLISVELMGITVSNPGGTGRCRKAFLFYKELLHYLYNENVPAMNFFIEKVDCKG
jgi:hypothetical protein